MIAHENGIETALLCRKGKIEQLARAELLGGSLVTEAQRQRHERLLYRFQLNATPLIAAATMTTTRATRLRTSKLAIPAAVSRMNAPRAMSIITTRTIAR